MKNILLFALALAIFASLFPAPAIVGATMVRATPGGAYIGRFCGGEYVTVLKQTQAYYKVEGWALCDDVMQWTVGWVWKPMVKLIGVESPKIP